MLIEAHEPGPWRKLQEAVAIILREAGHETKVDYPVPLVRGRKRIDVFGIAHDASPPSRLFVECKLWQRRVTQAEVHAFPILAARIARSFGSNRTKTKSMGISSGAISGATTD